MRLMKTGGWEPVHLWIRASGGLWGNRDTCPLPEQGRHCCGASEIPRGPAPGALGCPSPAPIILPNPRPGGPCGSLGSPDTPLGGQWAFPVLPEQFGLRVSRANTSLGLPGLRRVGNRRELRTHVSVYPHLSGKGEPWVQSLLCH